MPGPSPARAPDMPAKVLKNRTPKVRQQITSEDDALQQLNHSLSNRGGSRHLLPRPCLVDDIKELLAEPAAPEWVSDTSELELLNMVCQTKNKLSFIIVH